MSFGGKAKKPEKPKEAVQPPVPTIDEAKEREVETDRARRRRGAGASLLTGEGGLRGQLGRIGAQILSGTSRLGGP